MIFDKPSTRTRVSFEVAVKALGGDAVVLNTKEMQLGRGETIADTARVLSRYVDAIMIRTDHHAKLLELAEAATVPVINGLTDRSHPCQIMADVMTFEAHRGPIRDHTLAWTGDGNNVATSWIHAAQRFDFKLRLACPPELAPDPSRARLGGRAPGAGAAVRDADGGGRRRRRGDDRRLGLDGRQRARAPAPAADRLPGRRPADGRGRAGRPVHALPAGAPRRGGQRGRDRRAALGGLRSGREPAARAEGHPRLVPRPQLSPGATLWNR